MEKLPTADINLLSVANEYIKQLKFFSGSHPIRQQLIDLSIALLKTFLQDTNNKVPVESLIPIYISLGRLLVIEDDSKKYILQDETSEIIQNGILLCQRTKLFDKECQLTILSIRVAHAKGNIKTGLSLIKSYYEHHEKLINSEISIEFATQAFEKRLDTNFHHNDTNIGEHVCKAKKIIPLTINYLYLLIFLGIELFPNNQACLDRLKNLQELKLINYVPQGINNANDELINKAVLGINKSVPPTIRALSYIMRSYLLIKTGKFDEAIKLLDDFETNPFFNTSPPRPSGEGGTNGSHVILSDGSQFQISIMYYTGRIMCQIYQTGRDYNVRIRELRNQFINCIELFKDHSNIHSSSSLGKFRYNNQLTSQSKEAFKFVIEWNNFGFIQYSNSQNIDNLQSFVGSILSWLGGYPFESVKLLDLLAVQFDYLYNGQDPQEPGKIHPLDPNGPLPLAFAIKWLQCLSRFNPTEPKLHEVPGLVDTLYNIFENTNENEGYAYHCKLLEGLFMQCLGYYYQAFLQYGDIMAAANEFLTVAPKDREKWISQNRHSEIIALAIISSFELLGPDNNNNQAYREYMNTYVNTSNNQMISRLWTLVTFSSASIIDDSVRRGYHSQQLMNKTYLAKNKDDAPPNLTDVICYYILGKYRSSNEKSLKFSEYVSKFAYKYAPEIWKLLLGPVLIEIYSVTGKQKFAEEQAHKDDLIFQRIRPNLLSYHEHYKEDGPDFKWN